MGKFIGRKQELTELHALKQKKTSSMIVVMGRRRVGKSSLIEEFAKDGTFYEFAGLVPETGITAQSQRNEFARLLADQLHLPKLNTDDWGDLFWFLADKVMDKPCVILLDEISWMAMDDESFLPKLKNAWDLKLKKNPKLILVLCGSVSAWIEDNITNSTGFMGRDSLVLQVRELPLDDCVKFWGNSQHTISAYEKFKFLSVTGGIPRYLEEIKPALSAEENIRGLAFNPSGILFREFNQIFAVHFQKNSDYYLRIVMSLAEGAKNNKELCISLGIEPSGMLTAYLDELVKAGFISKHYHWDLKSGQLHEKQLLYRLSDNYLRFYIKYILPNSEKIQAGHFQQQSITALPGWEAIMGLQFENMVLNNRHLIYQALNINPADILCDNPYVQKANKRQAGCQVDYLIQTKFNTLYLVEIKFKKGMINKSIIKELTDKTERLQIPKHFSYRWVVLHVNGVSDDVIDDDYIYKTIDFGEFLT